MEKEKVMTIKYYILIGLLLISLFVGLIYLKKVHSLEKRGSNHVIKNKVAEKKEQPIEEKKSEEVTIDSPIAQELIKKISVFDTIKAGSYYGYFYQDYLDINNISNDAKIMIGITQHKDFTSDFMNTTYDATAPDGANLKVIILSKEDVEKGINNFFGPNTSYTDASLIDATTTYCGFSGFQFDETRNVYMNNPINCPGFPQPYIDTKIMNVQSVDDNIEITVKVAYIKYDAANKDDVIKYIYPDNYTNTYIEKHHILTDNSYKIDNILNNLNTYKFTFSLNSNNYYYFNKVEKI